MPESEAEESSHDEDPSIRKGSIWCCVSARKPFSSMNKKEKKEQARTALEDATANLKDLKPKLTLLRELEKRKKEGKD